MFLGARVLDECLVSLLFLCNPMLAVDACSLPQVQAGAGAASAIGNDDDQVAPVRVSPVGTRLVHGRCSFRFYVWHAFH